MDSIHHRALESREPAKLGCLDPDASMGFVAVDGRPCAREE